VGVVGLIMSRSNLLGLGGWKNRRFKTGGHAQKRPMETKKNSDGDADVAKRAADLKCFYETSLRGGVTPPNEQRFACSRSVSEEVKMVESCVFGLKKLKGARPLPGGAF